MKKIVLIATLFFAFISYAQETYYNGLDLDKEGLDLKEELAVKVANTHTKTLSYNELWSALKATDEDPSNANNVILIYGFNDNDRNHITDRTRSKNLNGGTTGTDWNREHVYANSKGTPNLGTSGPGADGQHLRPSDVKMNSNRGSDKFANGSGNAGSVSGGWYPGDEWKGDVARIMMYMYIRYDDQCLPINIGVGSSAATPDDMIDLFLKWNVEDPVSDFERQRNTYHENTSNTYAQGNRNPFIDNAYLATRIWGGENAIDSWGIYLTEDDEAPTVPTSVALSNITTSTIDVTWDASTDNNGIGKYEIYANGVLYGESTTTNYTVINLTPNTAYSITVLAKDIAGNESAQSTAVNGTTLVDNTPPTIPTDVTIASKSGTSLKITWTASTDDSAISAYNVYVDGTYNDSTTDTSFTITGLTVSTTYAITVLAKDTSNNESEQSTAVNGTTTDGSAPSNELFFSEYLEGGGNNKALEIANFTGQAVSLANYAVKLGSNGADFGTQILTFTNETIEDGDVFVIGNAQLAVCASEVDIESTVTYFNGNDVLGLFKNDVLIDIIGKEGDTNTFGSNVTLKRKSTIVSPNVVFDRDEWEEGSSVDDCTNLGKHTVSTASIKNENLTVTKMYPNPTNGDKLHFKYSEELVVNIYNVLGKLLVTEKVDNNNNQIDISSLSKGVYLVKINSENQFITKKLIKK